jgi:hypothetical protein
VHHRVGSVGWAPVRDFGRAQSAPGCAARWLAAARPGQLPLSHPLALDECATLPIAKRETAGQRAADSVTAKSCFYSGITAAIANLYVMGMKADQGA